jgi:23S rRNA (guanosine2251-2'-O)-methyltransferase
VAWGADPYTRLARVTLAEGEVEDNIVGMDRLIGIHAVEEALRAGREMERVLVARGAANPRLQRVIDACRERGVPVRFEPREALDRSAGQGVHQGVVAVAAARRYATLENVIAAPGVPALLVVLDGVEDPHNLGAIIRTAYAAAADAVVTAARRAAPLSETVAKAAAGALEYLPVARVPNLNRALELLKQRAYWIFGLDERADKNYNEADYRGRAALVLGGEGKGLHQQVARHCDFLVRIPTAGKIASLNVSVAAGVVLFEVRRQRS